MQNLNKKIDKKKKIINDYNNTAHFYDRRYRKIQEHKFKIILNNYRLTDKLILDAGCGTGLIIEYIIASTGNNEFIPYIYVGIDISWNMLTQFKIKLKKLKLKEKYHLILSDIEKLPFRENIFQVIFSLTSVQNLPNINSGFRNLYFVGKNKADLNLSILKKSIKLNKLIELLNPIAKNLKITNREDLEDIIIQGEIVKRECE